MKNKKLVLGLGAVALVATLTIGGTMAYFTDADEAQNVFTMGKVDGELTEPTWDENDTDDDGTIENVKPGDVIEKDPTLTLADDSEDAYVRFHVSFVNLTDEQADEIVFEKDGSEVVIGEDGYFYVEDIMSAGDEYVLFDTVVIPTSWGNEMASAKFEINVKAEMIQADNFTPDFTSATPWGDVTIEALN